MGKKMKLPFLFKAIETTNSSSSWPWNLTCGNPKTLSFRATNEMFNSMNPSSSTSALEEFDDGESIEKVIKGLRSERLFFEPGETSSILDDVRSNDEALFKESVAMAVDSMDPFGDFRRSMEEMVVAHGLKDWDCLEELLTCYLKVNGKNNHGYIVGAFVDLVVNLAFASNIAASTTSTTSIDDHCSSSTTTTTTTTTRSFTSPLSFTSSTNSSTSPCLSSLEAEDEILKSTNDNASSSSLSNVSSSHI